MCALSGVVHFEPGIEIRCNPNIASARVSSAAEYVNIMEFAIHGLPRRSSSMPLYIVEMSGFATNVATPGQSSFTSAANEEWRRGDSNPRPVMLQDKLLHA